MFFLQKKHHHHHWSNSHQSPSFFGGMHPWDASSKPAAAAEVLPHRGHREKGWHWKCGTAGWEWFGSARLRCQTSLGNRLAALDGVCWNLPGCFPTRIQEDLPEIYNGFYHGTYRFLSDKGWTWMKCVCLGVLFLKEVSGKKSDSNWPAHVRTVTFTVFVKIWRWLREIRMKRGASFPWN